MTLAGDVLIGLGLCISGYLNAGIIGVAFAVYVLKCIFEVLRAGRLGVLVAGPAGIGPTEILIALITLNGLLFFLPPHRLELFLVTLSYADLLGLVWILVFSVYIAPKVFSARSELANLEP